MADVAGFVFGATGECALGVALPTGSRRGDATEAEGPGTAATSVAVAADGSSAPALGGSLGVVALRAAVTDAVASGPRGRAGAGSGRAMSAIATPTPINPTAEIAAILGTRLLRVPEGLLPLSCAQDS